MQVKSHTESELKNRIRAILGFRMDIRIFNNASGFDKQRKVHYGMGIGSSDLIGFKFKTITQKDVGKSVAQFVAIEIKSQKGQPTAEQLAFIRTVRRFGGLSGIARTVREAEEIVNVD